MRASLESPPRAPRNGRCGLANEPAKIGDRRSPRPHSPHTMNSRLRLFLWIILALFVLAGVDLFRRARAVHQSPDLEQVCALARAGRYDDAQREMVQFLRLFPDHPRANLLMAQFSLDRP